MVNIQAQHTRRAQIGIYHPLREYFHWRILLVSISCIGMYILISLLYGYAFFITFSLLKASGALGLWTACGFICAYLFYIFGSIFSLFSSFWRWKKIRATQLAIAKREIIFSYYKVPSSTFNYQPHLPICYTRKGSRKIRIRFFLTASVLLILVQLFLMQFVALEYIPAFITWIPIFFPMLFVILSTPGLQLEKIPFAHFLQPALEVDEVQIKAIYGKQQSTIFWEDIDFFAVYEDRKSRKKKLTSATNVFVLLSDGKNNICWSYNTFVDGIFQYSDHEGKKIDEKSYKDFTLWLTGFVEQKIGFPPIDLIPPPKKESQST